MIKTFPTSLKLINNVEFDMLLAQKKKDETRDPKRQLDVIKRELLLSSNTLQATILHDLRKRNNKCPRGCNS